MAALLPSTLDAATLTPQAVHAASPEVQDAVALIYHDVFSPIFLALAAVYALGIVAAVALPADGSATRPRPPFPTRRRSRSEPRHPLSFPVPLFHPSRGVIMSEPTVVVVGSGPIGAAYARVLVESVPGAKVVMFEAGPQLTAIPGESVRNIADPAEKKHAREISQGPQAGSLRESLGLPAGVAVEGMFTAREGTHLIDFGGEGSGHASSFPAAAASTNVGGMGAHWTCATPSPQFSERIPFIDDAEWDDLLAEAKKLLHVSERGLRRLGGRRRHPLAPGGRVPRRAARGLRTEHAAGGR